MLTTDDFLVDVNRGERRFRVRELLFDAGQYQIALAEDTAMDDKLVCAKTVAYDVDRINDKKYVAMRRKALHEELIFLAEPIHLLPEPLDWIQLEHSDTVLGREPVLVYEYAHGQTLYELVTGRYAEGIAYTRALRIAQELARFLADLHRNKWVYRNLDPRHVVVGYDDVIHLVGCGNATRVGEAPNPERAAIDSVYIAPEARQETSGKLLRPAVDIYSLGALLSFALTGEEPSPSIENPLTKTAYERLTGADLPPGIALLVARLLQPMAKKRFGRAERLLPYLNPTNLPTPQSDGFGLLQLPAPWSGAERPDSRSLRSKLSAGPLISVDDGATTPAPATPESTAPVQRSTEDQPVEKKKREKRDIEQLVVVVFFVLSAIAAGAAAIFL